MQPIIHKLVIRSSFFTLLFSAIFLILLGGYLTWLDYNPYKENVYPGVYFGSQPVGQYSPDEVGAVLETFDTKLAKTSIEVAYSDTEIATFSGALLKFEVDEKKARKEIFSVGREENLIDKSITKIRHALLKQTSTVPVTTTYSIQPIKEYLSYLNETYAYPPQDARFELNGARVSAFQIEKPGITVDEKTAIRQVEKFLKLQTGEPATSSALRIKPDIIEAQPDIKIADINTFGIIEKIGEGKSNYSHSGAERIHNLSLATSRMHGILIPPGETFSYNKSLGEISARTGYKQGYVIQNGKTVLGDGGGVCQVSTTLFRAALNTGLPIVQRKAHSYRVLYYENDQKPGLDATAFAPSVDFKFKNDTDSHILIQTYNDRKNMLLHFEFYGKRDGRTVSLSPIKVWGVQPAPEAKYVDDPTLPRGVTKQIDFAATGAKSSYTYKVLRNGEVLQDRVFNSTYRPWQAVFLVGTQ